MSFLTTALFRTLAFFITVSIVLSSCGGSSTGGGVGSSGFSGQAQKGPFISGTNIWVSDLNSSLTPTGNTYITQVADDLGNFSLPSGVTSNLVEILANGYYMDELTGAISTSTTSVRAVVDLNVTPSPSINVLTELQTPRLISLMQGGMSYADASSQSQREVLSAFGIDASKVNSLNSFVTMTINGTTDQDAVLLATSVILSQMAKYVAALSGTSPPAELSYLLSAIGDDIKLHGTMTSPYNIGARQTAVTQIDLPTVRTNIQSYYANKGDNMTAPKFEEWIDSDNSGILPKRLLAVNGLNFNDIATADACQTITSNTVTPAGITPGMQVPVHLAISGVYPTLSLCTPPVGTIVKNGSAVNGPYSEIGNGDTLALQLTGTSFGGSVSSTLTVGSSSSTWKLTTRTPTIQYAPVVGNCSNWGSGGGAFVWGWYWDWSPAVYHAFPILPTSTFTAKYVGGAMQLIQVSQLSIYSDNGAGVPLLPLGTSNTHTRYFPMSTLPLAGGGSTPLYTADSTGFYLGSAGIQLQANTKYWIVVKFPSAYSPEAMDVAGAPFGSILLSSDGTTWAPEPGGWTCNAVAAMPGFFITD